MSPVRRIQWRKRFKRYAAAATALVVITAAGVVNYIGGSDDSTPGPLTAGAGVVITLSLSADADFVRMPTRSAFCGSVGTLGTPESCWTFGGSTGTITDQGSNGWDLTRTGSPREGVVTGLPRDDGAGAVDWTGEQAAGLDHASWYSRSVTVPSSAVYVYTAVVRDVVPHVSASFGKLLVLNASSRVHLQVSSTGQLGYYVVGTGGTKSGSFTGATIGNGASCVTAYIVVNAGSSSGVFVNGSLASSGIDTDVTATVSSAGSLFVGADTNGAVNSWSGLVHRARIDLSLSAPTLADHQALCGTLFSGDAVHSTAASYADNAWTQSGASRCFQTAANTATCFPGSLAGYMYRTGGNLTGNSRGWVSERARTQRVLNNVSTTCSNWTCVTSTIAASAAPDGSLTAASITHGGGTVTSAKATGYTNDAVLYPALWVKCSSGTLAMESTDGAGDWDIACATIGGAWTYINSASHAAVTENTAFAAAADGDFQVQFSGADVEIWAQSYTETAAELSVIPTGSSAATTGAPVWDIDNAAAAYHQAGDTVTQVIDEIAGTCFAGAADPILLTGSSTCTGVWQSLEISR